MKTITQVMVALVALWLGSSQALASSTRTIDADVITSSDKTKTYTMPASTGTLALSSSVKVSKKESFTLSGTDITHQYVDLTQVAETDSISFAVKGYVPLIEGTDYSVSYTGGAGGKTRVTFLNDLATGGSAALVSGDLVVVQYRY